MSQVLDQKKNDLGKMSWPREHIGHGIRDVIPILKSSRLILPILAGIVLGFVCLVSPLLGVALVLGFLFLLVALANPVILCYLVISAIVLTSGIERGRLFPLLAGNEVSLLGALGIAVLITQINLRRKITLPKYYWWALITLIGGVVIIPLVIYLLMGIRLTISNTFKMVAPIQYFLLFWLFTIIPKGESDRRKIVWWLLAFGLLVAIVGILQGVGIGFVDRILANLYASSHEEMAVRAGRITSLLGSWNSLGLFMMTIIFLGWAILFEVKQLQGRLFIMGVMALALLCLIASGSFAGIIGLVSGFFFLQFLSQHKTRSLAFLLIGTFVAILSIILLYAYLQPLLDKRLNYQFGQGGLVPHTLEFRFKVWREIFIPAIKKHFPWPVYPVVPSYYAWRFEESQYILLLFRKGLIGFLGFLAWVVLTLTWSYRRYRNSQGFDKAIASVAFTITGVLVIAGFTNEVFSFAGTVDYLWILLALIANSTENIS